MVVNFDIIVGPFETINSQLQRATYFGKLKLSKSGAYRDT